MWKTSAWLGPCLLEWFGKLHWPNDWLRRVQTFRPDPSQSIIQLVQFPNHSSCNMCCLDHNIYTYRCIPCQCVHFFMPSSCWKCILPPVHVMQLRKLEEALEASNQELEKSKEVLKTNENGAGLWLTSDNWHFVTHCHMTCSVLRRYCNMQPFCGHTSQNVRLRRILFREPVSMWSCILHTHMVHCVSL